MRSRLTGERPKRGATPASILSLHDAGYAAVVAALGSSGARLVLDVGAGEGFESVRLAGRGRSVVAVDRDPEALRAASSHAGGSPGDRLALVRSDAPALGLASGAFDAACSSHLIEHFATPAGHVEEVARVLAPEGTAYFLTPNAPCDFENPFHLHLFDKEDLERTLGRAFHHVQVQGLDGNERIKEDFARRRRNAERLLRLDVLQLRHRLPRSVYVRLYARALPVAYWLLARRHGVGADGAELGEHDWFTTDHVDDTTLVLFATCHRPRPPGQPEAAAPR